MGGCGQRVGILFGILILGTIQTIILFNNLLITWWMWIVVDAFLLGLSCRSASTCAGGIRPLRDDFKGMVGLGLKNHGIGLAKGGGGLSFQPFLFLNPSILNCSYDRKAAQLADLCLVTT